MTPPETTAKSVAALMGPVVAQPPMIVPPAGVGLVVIASEPAVMVKLTEAKFVRDTLAKVKAPAAVTLVMLLAPAFRVTAPRTG